MSARTGQLFDESFPDYLASDCIGSGDLNDLDPFPVLFYRKHIIKTVAADKDTEAKAFGRFAHCLLLEGEDEAAARFVQLPDGAPSRPQTRWLNAKKPRQDFIDAENWWLKWEAEIVGRQQITKDDSDLAWRLVESIRAKPSLCALLDPKIGRPEVTFRHPMKFFTLQCRSDWFVANWNNAGPLDVNLKTVENLQDFDRQFYKLGYYRKSAFYRAVIAKVLGLQAVEPQMAYLVVEKAQPEQAQLVLPDAQSLDIGWQEVEKSLMTLRKCFETGEWPGCPDVPRTVSLPDYVTRKANA